jgi:hypothetical protein
LIVDKSAIVKTGVNILGACNGGPTLIKHESHNDQSGANVLAWDLIAKSKIQHKKELSFYQRLWFKVTNGMDIAIFG